MSLNSDHLAPLNLLFYSLKPSSGMNSKMDKADGQLPGNRGEGEVYSTRKGAGLMLEATPEIETGTFMKGKQYQHWST